MKDQVVSRDTRSTPDSVRLHYLDWLRVLAILMVFLFHAVHPFDFGDWQVKNVEQSEIITIILLLLSIWGMPFFFLVAGAASWFALQKRTASQYLRERLNRLLILYPWDHPVLAHRVIYGVGEQSPKRGGDCLFAGVCDEAFPCH